LSEEEPAVAYKYCPRRRGLVGVYVDPTLEGAKTCPCKGDPSDLIPNRTKRETTAELIERTTRVLKSLSETHPEVKAIVEKPKTSKTTEGTVTWNPKTKKFE